MPGFEFATSARIIFGEGVFAQAAALAGDFGNRALVVSGLPGRHCEQLLSDLAGRGIHSALLTVAGEPTIELVAKGAQMIYEEGCNLVISLGGGSAIDTGKAAAILAVNPGEILDYLEVIGKGKSLSSPGLPLIAIPTTAGTGAEVTRNAVLGSLQHGIKVSLRNAWMLPKIALVDPELTYSLPPEITAATGLDALTQLIEPFVSLAANPLTDAICREGIRRAAFSLRKAYEDGGDPVARRELSLASLCGGLALANAKLGAVHGFAGPIGGLFLIPHGTVCACLLPVVMDVNVRALQAREPASPLLQRYLEFARIVTGNQYATLADGVQWTATLCADLKIPPLSHFGVTAQDISNLVEMAAKSSSMKGNPVLLTTEELHEIMQRAIAGQG